MLESGETLVSFGVLRTLKMVNSHEPAKPGHMTGCVFSDLYLTTLLSSQENSREFGGFISN